MCRTAGADFGLDPEESPSPLAQLVDGRSNSVVRVVDFDHYREVLTLCPWGVAESSIDILFEWFDDALVMVDREWGTEAYPCDATSVAVTRELVYA